MASRHQQQQRQKILTSTSRLKTPEMHASFECEAYEDPSQYEECAHRESQNWALAKGCADALRAPGSSRPRHRPKDPANLHGALASLRFDTCNDSSSSECDQDGSQPQFCRNMGPIPPDIKRIREEGLRRFSPLDYQMPTDPYKENIVFRAWGRKWIIKRSQICPKAGMGLFADRELIFVKVTPDDRHSVPLFPYIGPMYRKADYDAIANYYPHLRKYALDLRNCTRKLGDKTKERDAVNWVIAGTPHEDCNLAGYINSNEGNGEANCAWEEINHPAKNKVDDPWIPYSRDHDRKAYPFLDKLNSCQNPKFMHKYVMTVARRPLQVGDELLVDYPPY